MHPADAAFLAGLAGDLDLPRLLTITTRDGLVHRWTDDDRPHSDGVATFLPGGFAREAMRRLSYPTDGAASSTTAIFPLNEDRVLGFHPDDVIIGRYDAASVVLQVKHAEIDAAVMTLFSGYLSGGFRIDDRKRCTATIEGLLALLDGTEVHVLQAGCPAAFGENRWPYRCPFPIADWRRPGTVTQVLGAATVRVALTGADDDPAGHYMFGSIRFTAGALAFFDPPPTIVQHNAGAAAGEAVLIFGWNLGLLPTVGDTVVVSPGCARTFARCTELAALVDDPAVFDTRDYQGMLFLTGADLAQAEGA